MLLSDREELFTVSEVKVGRERFSIYYSTVLFNTTFPMEFVSILAILVMCMMFVVCWLT